MTFTCFRGVGIYHQPGMDHVCNNLRYGCWNNKPIPPAPWMVQLRQDRVAGDGALGCLRVTRHMDLVSFMFAIVICYIRLYLVYLIFFNACI